MTPRLWLLLLAFAAIMTALMYAYIRISRAFSRNLRAYRDAHTVRVPWPGDIVPGSGRMGEPKALHSPLSLPRTFSCPHMSIGGVVSASCAVCGPMRAAA